MNLSIGLKMMDPADRSKTLEKCKNKNKKYVKNKKKQINC